MTSLLPCFVAVSNASFSRPMYTLKIKHFYFVQIDTDEVYTYVRNKTLLKCAKKSHKSTEAFYRREQNNMVYFLAHPVYLFSIQSNGALQIKFQPYVNQWFTLFISLFFLSRIVYEPILCPGIYPDPQGRLWWPLVFMQHPLTCIQQRGLLGGGVNQDHTIKPIIDQRLQWINTQNQWLRNLW